MSDPKLLCCVLDGWQRVLHTPGAPPPGGRQHEWERLNLLLMELRVEGQKARDDATTMHLGGVLLFAMNHTATLDDAVELGTRQLLARARDKVSVEECETAARRVAHCVAATCIAEALAQFLLTQRVPVRMPDSSAGGIAARKLGDAALRIRALQEPVSRLLDGRDPALSLVKRDVMGRARVEATRDVLVRYEMARILVVLDTPPANTDEVVDAMKCVDWEAFRLADRVAGVGEEAAAAIKTRARALLLALLCRPDTCRLLLQPDVCPSQFVWRLTTNLGIREADLVERGVAPAVAARLCRVVLDTNIARDLLLLESIVDGLAQVDVTPLTPQVPVKELLISNALMRYAGCPVCFEDITPKNVRFLSCNVPNPADSGPLHAVCGDCWDKIKIKAATMKPPKHGKRRGKPGPTLCPECRKVVTGYGDAKEFARVMNVVVGP